MFKKVLTLMLVLVGIMALTACKPATEDPIDELTTLEQITEAMAQVDLPGTASSDLVFLAAGLHDVVITWESSNTDVIATDGTVTIPSFTDGDKTVTITAYFALGGETLTKTFTVEVLAPTEMSDLEKAEAAATAFSGLVSGNVIADITLPLVGLYDSTVVWATSDAAVVTTEGVVTRPAIGADNVSVTLTGTVTVGTATAEAVLTFTVVAEADATEYASISALYAAAILEDYIQITGVVSSVFQDGYFVTDGTNALGIYNPGNPGGVALGDNVTVKGYYANYNSLYQLSGLSSEVINSSGNANPLDGTAVVKTIAEMNALDSTDKLIHGMYYTITGVVTLVGDYDNVALVVGTDQVLVYYKSMADSITALEAVVGSEITITVFYYTDHLRDGVIIAYDGGEAGITLAALPDDEAIAADVLGLDATVVDVTLTDVVLPTEGANGTLFTAWTSSDATVLADDGTFVAVGATSTTVTFTGTATKGALTETVTVDVLVPVLSTVAEVLAMEKLDYFQVSGTVYSLYVGGFYIEQGGNYIFVYDYDLSQIVVEGDTITTLGQLDVYNGLIQVKPVGTATIDSQGNTAAVGHEIGTVGDLLLDTWQRGTYVTVTGMVSIEGDNSNAFITDIAGNKVEVYYKSDADVVKTFDGKIIEVEVIAYTGTRVFFWGVAADITEVTTYTDQYKADAAVAAIDLGALVGVQADLILPATDVLTGAAFVWTTSDAAVVTDAGVITIVNGSTPSATLTVVATVGTDTATRDIVITLIDGNDTTPLTVTEALAETNTTDLLLVTGVVTGTYLTWGDNEVVIQDPVTGAAIYVDFDVTGAVVGDLIVVNGELETYTSNGNVRRQLDSGSLVSIESSGNAVTVDAETDVAVIADAFADMKTYTTTLTVKAFDSYGYVFFDGSVDRDLTFSTDTFAPWFQYLYAVDDTVVVTFTVMDINYDNTRIVNVQLPVPTDAELLTAAVASIENPTPVTEDLVPVTEAFGVAISWASSDIAVIALDGTVTRPAIGELDAVVTLTATFSIGTETDVVVDYVVTVTAIPEPIVYDFTETFTNFVGGSSYELGDFVGDNTITWSYTESRGDFDLTGQAIMLDKDGDGASLTATITGGIGALSIDYYDAYSGSAQVIVIINEGLAGEVTYTSPAVDFDETTIVNIATFEVVGIDISGEFTISIYSGESQMVIDNLMWTAYTE